MLCPINEFVAVNDADADRKHPKKVCSVFFFRKLLQFNFQTVPLCCVFVIPCKKRRPRLIQTPRHLFDKIILVEVERRQRFDVEPKRKNFGEIVLI